MMIKGSQKYLCAIILSMIAIKGYNLSAEIKKVNEDALSASLDFASFGTDSSNLERMKDGNHEYYERITSMKWLIRGDTLRFGDDPLEVSVDKSRLDTILYWSSKDAIIPDSIICYISKPYDYRFRWNSCCGGFDVIDVLNENRYLAAMSFRLTEDDQKREFLGKIDSIGTRIDKGYSEVIEGICRSAMQPNIYCVQIEEVAECVDSAKPCTSIPCFKNKGILPDSLQYTYYYPYRSVRKRSEFLYMPLSTEALKLTFDPQEDRIWFTE